MAHRLLQFLLDAAIGRFPDADGGVTVLSALPNGSAAALLAFARATTIGTNDVTLGRLGEAGGGGGQLRPVTEWDDHPRVRFAGSVRTDVVYGDERGFVTLGSGLAGIRARCQRGDHHRVTDQI